MMMLVYFSAQILILWKYSMKMSTIRFFPVLCPDKIIKINLLLHKKTHGVSSNSQSEIIS